MKVDADYAKKLYAEWKPRDWPRHYQSPGLSESLCRGDRICSATSYLPTANERRRFYDLAGPATHGNAFGHDRQGGGS
jgi:hypothetical protein